MQPPFSSVAFLGGAARARQFPADSGVEVAFAGRSNAGKSSAINAITASKALARISKTPGRTREINFFAVSAADNARLVDLPGYGFARVPVVVKVHWARLVETYLLQRRSLRGVVLIMDVRRPFTALDGDLLEWCAQTDLSVHALLTKADKLSRGAAERALAGAQRQAGAGALSLQLFSARSLLGADQARAKLCEWLWPGAEEKKGPASQSGGKGSKPGPRKPGRGSRVGSRSGR